MPPKFSDLPAFLYKLISKEHPLVELTLARVKRYLNTYCTTPIHFQSSSFSRTSWFSFNLQSCGGCHQKTQKLGKSPNFGVISEIQRAKFGVFVIYIFGGKIWGSNKNFRGKIWGQAPPDLLIWKYPPGGVGSLCACL